jgi:hypothetical protein
VFCFRGERDNGSGLQVRTTESSTRSLLADAPHCSHCRVPPLDGIVRPEGAILAVCRSAMLVAHRRGSIWQHTVANMGVIPMACMCMYECYLLLLPHVHAPILQGFHLQLQQCKNASPAHRHHHEPRNLNASRDGKVP